MNRGRFIGLAGLPVLFLGVPTLAAEATSGVAAQADVADAAWAERWKAAVAERAARRVVEVSPSRPAAGRAGTTPQADDWAKRWKAAAEALEAQKAEVKRLRRPPAQGVKLAPTAVATIDVDTHLPAAKNVEPAKLLMLAPRRPRVPRPTADSTESSPVPPEGTDTAAPNEAPDAASPDAAAPVAPADAPATPDAAAAPAPVEEPAAPMSPDDELVPLDDYAPFGYADSPVERSRRDENDFGGRNRRVPQSDFLPVPDRFRIGLPGDYVQNTRGTFYDPYNQNVLKGDYPIVDYPGAEDDLFMILTLTSDTLVEARRLPVPTSVSANDPSQFDFFEDTGEQQILNQNFVATLELFTGDTVYKPRDQEFRVTVVGNVNYIHSEQQQVVNADFREGTDRYDEEFAFQELFYEKHLMDLSNSYDVLALRAGIQGFNSDFRGFLFSDNLPGIRLFGNYDNNRWQYNLAYFRQVEKDTNSGLNTFNDRNQNIFVANVYRQDFLFPGYTAQLSLHYNNDHNSNELEFDRNGFLVRPLPAGTIGNNEIDVVYFGWAGDGHIGRLNLSHQFYQAFGRESFNAIAGREVDVNAQFAAIEASYDVDYIRYRASVAYASGDRDPDDGEANGFDSIFDNPNFAGGGTNFFIRQPLRLTGSGIGLTQRLSMVPNLRTSKEQGQANFVNPGLLLFNVGADFEVTPKLKVIGNASYLRFVNSSSMELLVQDNMIDEEIGADLSVGVIYRPFLNNNVIVNGGAACLIPGQGLKDLYGNETLYSFFTGVTFTY